MADNRTVKRLLRLRRAGETSRVHTLPYHGEYTVGRHSYDACAILAALHPAPSRTLLLAMLFHDAAEHYLGDMPAHAKKDFPELSDVYEATEAYVLERLDVYKYIVVLSEEDEHWLRSADQFELWLWARDQVRLGNSRARVIMTRLEQFWTDRPLVTEVWSAWKKLHREDGRYDLEDDDDRGY